MTPKLKRLLDDTPAQVSGGIVLVLLLCLLALVVWSGLHHPKTALRFLFGTCVGGVVAYRVFRTGGLRLDAQRAVRQFHEYQMEGRVLTVNEARSKAERAPRW